MSTHAWASTHGRASTHSRVWDAGSWRGEIQALVGTGSTSPVHGRDTEQHVLQQLPRGLTLAESWDVRVATFSCEDSSSRRSLRICCGERAEGVRRAGRWCSPSPRWPAQVTRRGRGLTSDCIFSSAWQRESRERQTDRAGSQEGSEAGQAQHEAEACTEPPAPTPASPSHAASGTAQQRLLRRSRWRTRWKPGTALIRELQQNKTRRVRVLQSVPPLGLQLQDTAEDRDGAPRAGEAPQGPGEADGGTVAAQHCSCLGMWLVTPQGTWSSLHLLPAFQLSLGALSPSLAAWDPPIPSTTTPWDHPRDTRHPWGQGWL